ncbi:hypothetical protein FRC12_003319 [Ceratobasidium sp. 428]|nr:hypothetical protein FRC12_003319 [Ceratobasidium sp. 428]
MASGTHNGRTIFGYSKITSRICNFCDAPERVRISRLCHAAFQGAAPLIWKYVKGVHNFLALLPELEVTVYPNHHTCNLHLQERWPKGTNSKSATTRLQIYAASVKTLKVYSEPILYRSFHWPILAPYLQSQILLPSLRVLDVSHSDGISAGHYSLWVRMFACQSLGEVILAPRLFSYSEVVCGTSVGLEEMLDVVAEKSPHIWRLSVHPTFDCRSDDESQRDLLDAATHTGPPFRSLQSLSRLTVLSCNTAMLVSCLNLLGDLPQLESLTVWSGGRKDTSFEQEPLSDSSFPVLTHLNLNFKQSIDALELKSVLCMIPALRNLTALRFCMEMYKAITDENSWVQDLFLPSLKSLPRLGELYFNCFPEGKEHLYLLLNVSNGSRKFLDSIMALPLETVCFDMIHLGYYVPQIIKAGWPHITHFSVPFQRTDVQQLQAYTRLSNLQHLTLDLILSIEYSEDSDDSNDFYSFGGSVGTMLHTLEGGPGSRIFCKTNEIEELTRCLKLAL